MLCVVLLFGTKQLCENLVLTLLCTVQCICQRIVRPFKFARLKGFERLENCLTKGTFER